MTTENLVSPDVFIVETDPLIPPDDILKEMKLNPEVVHTIKATRDHLKNPDESLGKDYFESLSKNKHRLSHDPFTHTLTATGSVRRDREEKDNVVELNTTKTESSEAIQIHVTEIDQGSVMSELYPNGIYLNTPDEFEKFSLVNNIIAGIIQFIERDPREHDIDVLCLIAAEMDNL